MGIAKGKKKGVLTRQERFEASVSGMKARYPGKVMMGREYTAPWSVRRVPTGILNLDIATNGGLPCGGMSMFVGGENAGKNWLLFQCIKQQQIIYGDDCRFGMIGTEMAFDKDQARKCGVKVAFSETEIEAKDRALFRKKGKHLLPALLDNYREQVGHFVIVPPETAEKSFELCAEMVDENVYNIVSIDSFGSILTEEEKDKSMEDKERVAGAAGLNTRLMRKLNAAFAPEETGDPNLTCLIGTNQLRDAIKAQAFQKQTHESGGRALKHGRFVTVELTRIAWMRRGKGKTKRDKEKIGRVMKWSITKQKAGGHDGIEGEYNFMYAPTLHHDRGVMALLEGVPLGLIDKAGSHYSYEGIKIGNGLDNAARFLAKNDLLTELEEQILEEHGVRYLI